MADTLTQYAMAVPNKKRAAVVKIFATASVIAQYLNFIDIGDAMGYEYSKEGALPGIGFRSLNGSYSHTEGDYAVNPLVEGTSIMGGLVQTDRQMLGRKGSRVNKKVQAAGLYFDRMFFDGDSETDAKQFDGINKRLGTGAQVITMGTNGAQLTLANLSKMIDRVIGADSDKKLLMSAAMRRTLGNTIIAAGATTMSLTEWQGPLKPKSYDGIEIVVVGEDETGTEILGFDETCGTSAVTGSIYCFAFGRTEDEDRLQGICKAAAEGFLEVEEQGVRGTSDQTLVEGRVGLAMFHGRSVARLRGILEYAAS